MKRADAKRYRKKPIIVEAMQYLGKPGWIGDWMRRSTPMGKTTNISYTWQGDFYIYTKERDMLVLVGDWVVRGETGGFHLCKPDIFAATYEEVK